MNLQPTFQNSVLLPWYLSLITDIILVPGWYIGVSMLPFFKESKNIWLDIFTELHTELIETREEARAARPAEKLRDSFHYTRTFTGTQVTVIIAENMICAPDGIEIADQHRKCYWIWQMYLSLMVVRWGINRLLKMQMLRLVLYYLIRRYGDSVIVCWLYGWRTVTTVMR